MRLLIVSLAALTMLVAVACGDDNETGDEQAPAAATFEVDSTTDAVDANPGDAVCDDGFGRCTLRAAIMEANNLAGRVAINLPAGTYALSIAGREEDAAATGDLDLADDLAITGDGADTTIVDGGGLDRVFHILPGSTVDITGVAVRNGNPGDASGGGIFNDKGRTLTLTDSTVAGNSAATLDGGISNNGELDIRDSNIGDNEAKFGGGIANDGTLTLSGSTVAGNSAAGLGGGISNDGELDISDSTVRDNEAKFGGGIANDGTLTLSGSTVAGNSVAALGGGIFNNGKLDVSDSTVSDNEAETTGGGIFNQEGGTLTLTASIVAGNLAGLGGGILNEGELDISDSTVRDNEATSGGGISNEEGGTLTLTASIVAGNLAGLGGGIFNNGKLDISDSTVRDNEAKSGGGIFNFEGGTLTLTASIVAGNLAGLGGGIPNDGKLDISDSTVRDNEAELAGGGISNEEGGTLTLRGSTVRGNSAPSDPEIYNADGSVKVIDAPPGIIDVIDWWDFRERDCLILDDLREGIARGEIRDGPLRYCSDDTDVIVVDRMSCGPQRWGGDDWILQGARDQCPESANFWITSGRRDWESGIRVILCLQVPSDSQEQLAG